MPASKETIVIGSDHGGFTLKEYLRSELGTRYKFHDVGCHSVESVDYPDYVEKAIEAMREEKISRCILICGTGIGVSIAANKYKGIRAAPVYNIYSAQLSRLHNDLNVLCLGQRILGEPFALEIARAWLETKYEGGRHDRRLAKIVSIETEGLK